MSLHLPMVKPEITGIALVYADEEDVTMAKEGKYNFNGGWGSWAPPLPFKWNIDPIFFAKLKDVIETKYRH